MATENVNDGRELTEGFGAFKNLMRSIKTLSNDTTDPDAEEDTRDYVALFYAVANSIDANIESATPGHRAGYLRSLTDLLCMSADGVSPGENWNPIENTAHAFAGCETPFAESRITSDRTYIALQASWEIDSIAQLVHDHMSLDAENLAYRALLRRCKRLSSVIMSALGEPNMSCATLENMLNDGEVSRV